MQILLIEDDELVARGIVSGLRLHGLMVDRVGTATAAQAALDSFHFDVCILDLRFQDEDGMALLRRWRTREQSLSVLDLTARDAVEYRVEGLQAGAHELRTPLTGIKTHLQVMRLAAQKADSVPVARQALADAEWGVLRLQNTLDQLLLLARLEGSLHTASPSRSFADVAAKLAIDDAQTGQHAKRRVRLVLPSRAIALAVPEPLLVCALRNLFYNAMRYSTCPSEVVLRAETNESHTVAFCVCDEGPGLSEVDCALATQRFWRLGTASQGSGLELSIVSEIARRYAGSLQLRPRHPVGLEGCLTFPASSDPQPSADSAPAS